MWPGFSQACLALKCVFYQGGERLVRQACSVCPESRGVKREIGLGNGQAMGLKCVEQPKKQEAQTRWTAVLRRAVPAKSRERTVEVVSTDHNVSGDGPCVLRASLLRAVVFGLSFFPRLRYKHWD